MIDANRVRRPLELSGILERTEAIYLVHVTIEPDGRPSRVRVTAATEGAEAAVLGAGVVLTRHLALGGGLDDPAPAGVAGEVAAIAADTARRGAAIARAAIRFAEQRAAREARGEAD